VNGAAELHSTSERLGTLMLGRSLEVRETTSSTNDDAREAAEAGAVHGHAVVADAQSSGRGSHGKTWSSPPDSDLYVSVVIRPRLEVAALPWVTLAAGVAVAETVDELLGSNIASVKWPNDVLVHDRKISGILVESASVGARVSYAVVGIGLNVRRREWTTALDVPATSLALEGLGTPDRAHVLSRTLLRFEQRLTALEAGRRGEIMEAIRARLAWRGREVTVGDATGVLVGVADDGALVLAGEGRTLLVRSGTLRLRAP
jgi:BirA family biotin operon repressor/biotin-[acetyl-CoA-carboxylase] ligase